MEKIALSWLLLYLLIIPNYGSVVPDESVKKLQEEIENLSSYLNKFNVLYLTSLEQKLSAISTAVAVLDTNVKALQEKAHVWDIFQHHIQAWTDNMKSVDHKIDLIKLTQDETQSIENKLNSLEFAINHVITKVDTLNAKNQDLNPLVTQKLGDIYKIVYNRERADGYEKKEMLVKLSALMRHVLTIENDSVRKSRQAKASKVVRGRGEHGNRNLEDLEDKVDKMLEEISDHDLDQVISVTKKNSETIEDILELVQGIDERTIRLFDAEANHSSKMLSCCRSSNDELTTFTASADLLLKRIEQLMLSVQNRVEKDAGSKEKDTEKEESDSDNEPSSTDESNKKPTIESKDQKDENGESDGSNQDDKEVNIDDKDDVDKKKDENGGNDETNNTSSQDERDNEAEDEPTDEVVENVFPEKAGCHELTDRIDGIYKFRNESLLGDRNFNERYCSFPTDGMGWTVIQRRGPYEIQENFNRTWDDYKYGFGDLNRDFWFGNEFINRMVYKDSYELRIELEDFEDVQVWAEYSTFQIDPEKYNYKLMIGGYRGAVSDSMLYHHDMDFSTYDRRQGKPCADGYGSGWWFDNCLEANLNGIYRDKPQGHNYIGIVWENWHGDYSLKKSKMLIRPKNIWHGDEDDEIFPELPPEDP